MKRAPSTRTVALCLCVLLENHRTRVDDTTDE